MAVYHFRTFSLLVNNYTVFLKVLHQARIMGQNKLIDTLVFLFQVFVSVACKFVSVCCKNLLSNATLHFQANLSHHLDQIDLDRRVHLQHELLDLQNLRDIDNFFLNLDQSRSLSEESKDKYCSICTHSFNSTNEDMVLLDCSKRSFERWYHQECLRKSFQSKFQCPFCRQQGSKSILDTHCAARVVR